MLRRTMLKTSFAAFVAPVAAPAFDVSAVAATQARQPDQSLLPFATTSPWRLGVSRGAQFAPASDPRNISMADVDSPGSLWINHLTYSHPVNYARASDPIVTIRDDYHEPDWIPAGGLWRQRVPYSARIAAGTDAHMHVVGTRRRKVFEHFAVTRNPDGSYNTLRRHAVSLEGSGIGPQNGTRAYGGSAIGGLIRAWEVDVSNPHYTGVIAHPLAMALRPTQLLYTGMRKQDGHGPMYDGQGYGLAQGYVWPATEQDGNSPWNYKGLIPMGSYFAIPGNVDLASLQLSGRASRMVAQAAQDYGVYITDQAGASVFYLEDSPNPATSAFAQELKGPRMSGGDLRAIVKALRLVTNNRLTTPNGGPLGSPRRGGN